MKRFALLALVALSLNAHADSTGVAIGKKLLYMNIPNVLGFEYELPFKFFAGGQGILNIDLNIKKNGFNFNQGNTFDIFVYREFQLRYFSLAPIAVIVASSEEFEMNNPARQSFLGLMMYHRFLICDKYEITPSITFLQIRAMYPGVQFHGNIYPELKLGIHF